MWRTGLVSSSCKNKKKRPLAVHHRCIHLTYIVAILKTVTLQLIIFHVNLHNEVFEKKKLTVRQKQKKQFYYNKNMQISSIIPLIFHLFFLTFRICDSTPSYRELANFANTKEEPSASSPTRKGLMTGE